MPERPATGDTGKPDTGRGQRLGRFAFRDLFGAKAQIMIGATLFLGSCVGWPLSAITVFRHEPQGILGLSWGAMVLAGYNIMATGLGYRKTEHVETAVIKNADTVEVDGR